MRLNRFLASAGLGSRRGCEVIILEGRVTVNGAVCTDLSTKVGENDFVKVGGKRIQTERTLSAILNKPPGFLCTNADPEGRRMVGNLLVGVEERVYPVGRLDSQSTGLLLEMKPLHAALVFVLTLGMCMASGCLAMRKVLEADPAELFGRRTPTRSSRAQARVIPTRSASEGDHTDRPRLRFGLVWAADKDKRG